MRLCQFKEASGDVRIGVRTPSGSILPVFALTGVSYTSMTELVKAALSGEFAFEALIDRAAGLTPEEEQSLGALDPSDLQIMAPVTDPPKFFAVAINGRENWERAIKPEAKTPHYFIKLRTCITGPFDPIEIPDIGSVGPEIELALVIGKGGKHIPKDKAMEHVFGYTVHNDLTAHHLRATSEWIRLRRKDGSEEQLTYPGRWKNYDTFSPMGPWLVTPDEVPAPHNLKMSAHLNGELVQDGTTADYVYPVPEIISYLSDAHTLEPGDIISMGTVPAVPPWTMPKIDLRKFGGTISCEVEGLGKLENPIVAI